MKTKLKFITLAVLIAALLTTSALAASGYEVNWWTVDSSGGVSQSTGGQYTLQGTIGQPDTGSSSGGEYGLEGGFWAGFREWVTQFFIYLPLVLR